MLGIEEEIEWGWRPTAGGQVKTPYVYSESATRRVLGFQEEGKYVVVRRTVGPWIDAPESTGGPDRNWAERDPVHDRLGGSSVPS